MDVFITQAFTHSKKSAATINTYQSWIVKLCDFARKPHPLDITIDDITRFYVYLSENRHYSPPSLELVRSAITYFYCVLCREGVPESMRAPVELSEGVKTLFAGRHRYKHGLPEIASLAEMQAFLQALPDTNAGKVITKLYSGRPLKTIMEEIKPLTVSVGTLQQTVARTARKVGILHGFGLRGVRASGLVHRLRDCTNDYERLEIFHDSGLKWQQFKKYVQRAGVTGWEEKVKLS